MFGASLVSLYRQKTSVAVLAILAKQQNIEDFEVFWVWWLTTEPTPQKQEREIYLSLENIFRDFKINFLFLIWLILSYFIMNKLVRK